jgi:hypothetical protein
MKTQKDLILFGLAATIRETLLREGPRVVHGAANRHPGG